MKPTIEPGAGNDLHIERIINAPRDVVWRCWTVPDLMSQWYCPKPWQADVHQLDLWPGGKSSMTFNGPEGETMPLEGIHLFVDPGRTLVFTDAFREGFIPQPESFMTGYVLLEDAPDGTTKMIWGARHATEESRQKHIDMGFEQGWGAASEQLNELAQSLASA